MFSDCVYVMYGVLFIIATKSFGTCMIVLCQFLKWISKCSCASSSVCFAFGNFCPQILHLNDFFCETIFLKIFAWPIFTCCFKYNSLVKSRWQNGHLLDVFRFGVSTNFFDFERCTFGFACWAFDFAVDRCFFGFALC